MVVNPDKVKSKGNIWLYCIIITFSIYSAVFSYVVIERYLSFNANIFDLGLASSYLYSIGHGGLISTAADPRPFPVQKMIVLVIAPFFNLFPDPLWLVVFQSIWMGLGIFPLYAISSHILRERKFAAFISISYLLYYPLSGVNWFDFHFMALFPTFFLFGFYFHLVKRNGISVLSMLLATVCDYLVPLIMIFYAFHLLLVKKEERIKELKFASVIIGISLIIFIGAMIYTSRLLPLDYTNLTGTSTSTSFGPNYLSKISYLLQMQFPVIFTSFLAPETLLMSVPYYALAFVNNYQPYISTMYFQYPALTAPIIFISSVYGLRRIRKYLGPRSNFTKYLKTVSGILIAVILVLNVGLFSFYSPIGELYTSNKDGNISTFITGNDFSYNAVSSINVSICDIELAKMIHQIPKGSSVLIQNNMPQLSVYYNWTLPDFYVNNTFPTYIVIDPYSYYYSHYSVAYHETNYTMQTLSKALISTGRYSVFSSYKEIEIFKLN